MAQIRCFVNDLDEAVLFYTRVLGFTLTRRTGDAMAIVALGDLALWLTAPSASASLALPDGRKPAPGGWSRIVLIVEGLDPLVKKLKSAQVRVLQDAVPGLGGRRALVEDPSGNVIEIVETD